MVNADFVPCDGVAARCRQGRLRNRGHSRDETLVPAHRRCRTGSRATPTRLLATLAIALISGKGDAIEQKWVAQHLPPSALADSVESVASEGTRVFASRTDTRPLEAARPDDASQLARVCDGKRIASAPSRGIFGFHRTSGPKRRHFWKPIEPKKVEDADLQWSAVYCVEVTGEQARRYVGPSPHGSLYETWWAWRCDVRLVRLSDWQTYKTRLWDDAPPGYESRGDWWTPKIRHWMHDLSMTGK